MIDFEEYPGCNDNNRPEKKCKNCRHYCPFVYELDLDGDEDELVSDHGECRRFPPKNVAAEEQAFPVVDEDSWCGEFDI